MISGPTTTTIPAVHSKQATTFVGGRFLPTPSPRPPSNDLKLYSVPTACITNEDAMMTTTTTLNDDTTATTFNDDATMIALDNKPQRYNDEDQGSPKAKRMATIQ